MNVSYKWLKDYVDFDLSPEEVAAALTSGGLEVDSLEEVQSIKGGLIGLFVGGYPRHASASHHRRSGQGRRTPADCLWCTECEGWSEGDCCRRGLCAL